MYTRYSTRFPSAHLLGWKPVKCISTCIYLEMINVAEAIRGIISLTDNLLNNVYSMAHFEHFYLEPIYRKKQSTSYRPQLKLCPDFTA